MTNKEETSCSADSPPTPFDTEPPGIWYDDRELIKTRNYKAGYQVRTENRRYGYGDSDGTPPSWITMKSAYNLDGDYIGNSTWGHRLVAKRGIAPELRTQHSQVCSIGFCEKEEKWYGWSHRAIFGFGVGAVVKEGDCTATSGWTDEYLKAHPEADTSLPVGTVAHTLSDARDFAVAFAESVG